MTRKKNLHFVVAKQRILCLRALLNLSNAGGESFPWDLIKQIATIKNSNSLAKHTHTQASLSTSSTLNQRIAPEQSHKTKAPNTSWNIASNSNVNLSSRMLQTLSIHVHNLGVLLCAHASQVLFVENIL